MTQKVQMWVGTLAEEMFKCQNLLGMSMGGGGTLVIHNVWYIRCFCYLQSPHSTANKTCMFPRQKSTQVDQQADQQAKRTLNKRKLVFMFYPDTNNCFNEDM